MSQFDVPDLATADKWFRDGLITREAALQLGLPLADSSAPAAKAVRKVRPVTVPASRLSLSIMISPLRLASEANMGGPLGAKIGRKTMVKDAVRKALPKMVFPLPCEVTMTRTGGKRLDDDNLRRAMKSVRDVIADWLGVDDADPRVRWRYDRRAGYVMGCLIKVRERS